VKCLSAICSGVLVGQLVLKSRRATERHEFCHKVSRLSGCPTHTHTGSKMTCRAPSRSSSIPGRETVNECVCVRESGGGYSERERGGWRRE